MPTASVMNALASTSRNTMATRFWESRPLRSTMAENRRSSGRTRTSMTATYPTTSATVRPAAPRFAAPSAAAHQRRIELEPDQEHEEDDAVLAQDLEVGDHGRREERGGDARGHPPEERGAEQDAAHHLAHHLRLPDGPERDAEQARYGEDDEDVDGDDAEQALGGHQRLGRRAARGRRLGLPDCGPIHTRPPRKCSRFQIGTIAFRRSISQRQAANASARCPAETAIATLAWPMGTSPTRCAMATFRMG